MEIVQAPYLIDFGKVYLDHPPSYWSDPQMRENIYAEWRERFEEHWEEVAGVMFMLQKYGIYYVDPRESNINTQGLEP
ncbi:hypothetical protein Pla123a_05720 [Posidoniimonas polymericola]|uniref:Uncharacterized protein n=2 Tax=Posidoniimonas polymericola TaxID=2528002 RepID=A0A5C5ZF85_9BACT|nr:hypothetical protein Pla123a_05720 [Posidoniimonas polymericola]